MCLFVYLVTDSALPEIPWDKRRPAFNVQRLKRKEKFLRNLSGANAYVLGSSEGCGCGFMSSELDDPEERAPAAASRQALREYVEGIPQSEGHVVLLAAWDGDEGNPAVRATITSRDLLVYPWDQTWEAPHLIEVTRAPGKAALP
jgi:hypothetical protein